MSRHPTPKQRYSIDSPMVDRATVAFYADNLDFREAYLSPENKSKLFAIANHSSPSESPRLYVYRYKTNYCDSLDPPPAHRGFLGDLWSSGETGKLSNTQGLQHYVKMQDGWLKLERNSRMRINHPFLPNVYLIERFWVSDLVTSGQPASNEASTSVNFTGSYVISSIVYIQFKWLSIKIR